jgi:hypothetical protein
MSRTTKPKILIVIIYDKGIHGTTNAVKVLRILAFIKDHYLHEKFKGRKLKK